MSYIKKKKSWTEWKPPAIKFQKALNTHCLASTLLFSWITVQFSQSCSCSLNVLNLKIICKIWHLAGTVYSSDYYLNTYYFTKCTITFHFHNSLYGHTAYTASFFIFSPLFIWITVQFCQSCSCFLNLLNIIITCKIWHLAGTVCLSYYYLNTYCFTKCTIIFCFHNSLYVHTAYTASSFMFLNFLFLHLQNSLISTLLFLMMPKGERIYKRGENVERRESIRRKNV